MPSLKHMLLLLGIRTRVISKARLYASPQEHCDIHDAPIYAACSCSLTKLFAVSLIVWSKGVNCMPKSFRA